MKTLTIKLTLIAIETALAFLIVAWLLSWELWILEIVSIFFWCVIVVPVVYLTWRLEERRVN